MTFVDWWRTSARNPGVASRFWLLYFPTGSMNRSRRRDRIRPDSVTFFQQLLEWWDDDAVRTEVISAHESAAWPDWLRRGGIAEGLRIGSVDHWLALLVLGACRSLGRTQDRSTP